MNPALKRQQLAIDGLGLALCLAMIGTAYFLLFAPLLHQKAEALGRYKQLASQRHKLLAQQGMVRQLKAELANLRASDAKDPLQPAQLVPTNARLAQITSLAAARRLEIKDVEPGNPRQESHFQATPLRLTGAGSFTGCLGFLHDIRHTFHDTTVVDFKLTGAPQANQTTITFDLRLCWYTAPALASTEN